MMYHKMYYRLKQKLRRTTALKDSLFDLDINDVPLILSFIEGLAAYERISDKVIASETSLRKLAFVEKKTEVLIGEAEG